MPLFAIANPRHGRPVAVRPIVNAEDAFPYEHVVEMSSLPKKPIWDNNNETVISEDANPTLDEARAEKIAELATAATGEMAALFPDLGFWEPIALYAAGRTDNRVGILSGLWLKFDRLKMQAEKARSQEDLDEVVWNAG